MKKTALIFSLMALFYGCAGSGRPLLTDVETEAHKSNQRLALYMEDHRAELSAQGDEFLINFYNELSISPVAEARLRALKYPCTYAGIEGRKMKFICLPGAKVYPEIGKDSIDLIFTE